MADNPLTQRHNPNQPQQQPQLPQGVNPPNSALWNELQQRHADQVQRTQQLNQNAFAALSRAKPDTRIFPSGPNASPNGPQQQQQQQSGVPGLQGLGLANGVGNGGGGGPVEGLQSQSQNQNQALFQLAAQRINGLTPQQIATMNPQQKEQLRQILENQHQQQICQARDQQQSQQQQQQNQQPSQQLQQNQAQFNNGQGGQQPPLGANIPGLGQMGQSAAGFPGSQPAPQSQGPSHSNGQDGAAFLESIISLPMEAFRNQLIGLKSKMKAFEDQRDRCLQVKSPQAIEQAQKFQAQVNNLQTVMHQLTEAYTRRQAANIGLIPHWQNGNEGIPNCRLD